MIIIPRSIPAARYGSSQMTVSDENPFQRRPRFQFANDLLVEGQHERSNSFGDDGFEQVRLVRRQPVEPRLQTR